MARDFDGTDDVAESTSAAVQDVPVSFSLWFNADVLANAGMMAVISNADENGFALNLRSTGAVRARASNDIGFAESATTTATTSTGVWTHAGAVWAASNSIAVYLNGGNKVTDADTLAINGTLNRTLFGATREAATLLDFYNGKLAEAGIWNVALTDAEMAILGTGVSPLLVRPQSLVQYVPMFGAYSPEISPVRGGSYTLTGTTASPHPRVFQASQRYMARVLAGSPPVSTGRSWGYILG